LSRPFAEGLKAFGFCDRCGFRYKLSTLKDEVVDLEKTGLLVCSECWDSDHPQNQLGRFPVDDPQALRNPRPDTGLIDSRYGKDLVFDFTTAKTGTHTQGSNVFHSLNNFVYRLNVQANSSSSMTWNSDSFYATLSENSNGGDKYQILSREENFGGSDSLVDIDPSKYKELQISIRKSAPFSPIPESDKNWTGYDQFGAFAFKTNLKFFSDTITSMPEPNWGNGIGGWDLITLDLSNNTNWTGATKVTELQFRFYEYPGSTSESILDSYDLSWIKFIHY
jgi:hypothetical protein